MIKKKHHFQNSSLLDSAQWQDGPVPGLGLPNEDYPILTVNIKVLGGITAYQYLHVPESRFDELVAAKSAGQFYNQSIKGVFQSKKIL